MEHEALFQKHFRETPTGDRLKPPGVSAPSPLSTRGFTPFSGRAWDIATVRAAVDAWARGPCQRGTFGGRNGCPRICPDYINRLLQSKPYMTAYAFYSGWPLTCGLANNAFAPARCSLGFCGKPRLLTRSTPRYDLAEYMGPPCSLIKLRLGSILVLY